MFLGCAPLLRLEGSNKLLWVEVARAWSRARRRLSEFVFGTFWRNDNGVGFEQHETNVHVFVSV